MTNHNDSNFQEREAKLVSEANRRLAEYQSLSQEARGSQRGLGFVGETAFVVLAIGSTKYVIGTAHNKYGSKRVIAQIDPVDGWLVG